MLDLAANTAGTAALIAAASTAQARPTATTMRGIDNPGTIFAAIGKTSTANPKPLAATDAITIPTNNANGGTVLALRMPGLDSPDFPALEVLSDVLNNERGDLFALVPAGKALSTGFSLNPLLAPAFAQMGYFKPPGVGT